MAMFYSICGQKQSSIASSAKRKKFSAADSASKQVTLCGFSMQLPRSIELMYIMMSQGNIRVPWSCHEASSSRTVMSDSNFRVSRISNA